MFDPSTKLNHTQKVLTKPEFDRLVANFNASNAASGGVDHAPVVKFFNPVGAATWFLSELDPETGFAFGMCDLGMGFPELGDVDLNEMIAMKGRLRFGMSIERDLHFSGDKPVSEYTGND